MKMLTKEAMGCFTSVLHSIHLPTSYTYRVFFRSYIPLQVVLVLPYLPSAYSCWGPFHWSRGPWLHRTIIHPAFLAALDCTRAESLYYVVRDPKVEAHVWYIAGHVINGFTNCWVVSSLQIPQNIPTHPVSSLAYSPFFTVPVSMAVEPFAFFPPTLSTLAQLFFGSVSLPGRSRVMTGAASAWV